MKKKKNLPNFKQLDKVVDIDKRIIVVTGNSEIPKSIITNNATIMVFDDFIYDANSEKGIDIGENCELYFEEGTLNTSIYDIKNKNIKVMYFNSDGVIEDIQNKKEPSKSQNNKEFPYYDYRKNELCVNLSNIAKTYGHILISGKSNKDKDTFIKNIMNKISLNYLTFFPNNVKIDFIPKFTANKDDIKMVAEMLDNEQKEMTERLELLEQEEIDNIYKIESPIIKTKIIIINGLDDYVTSSDYKSANIIKNAVMSIAKFGLAVGMMLIISCERLSGAVIPTELMNNMNNHIYIGSMDEISAWLMFGIQENIEAPSEMGFCQIGYEHQNKLHTFSIYNS